MYKDKSPLLPFFLAPALLAGACTAPSGGTGAGVNTEESQSITMLHTNDMHGSYMPLWITADNATAQTGDAGRDTLLTFGRHAQIGGFDYLAGAIKKVRQQKGADQVLLVDGGDTFGDDQLANLTRGEAMIRLMNQVGYDLMALGNHDFDYGLERTRQLQQLARFPMRGANILDEQTQKPIFGEPYIIAQKNGVKVAVLALGYRNTPKTGNPDNVKGLRFSPGPEVARTYVPQLRQKADVVVLLSHEGKSVDELMARQVPGIDLIIGAHSHDIIEPRRKIGQTFLVQAMSDAAVLGETELVLKGKKLTDVKDHYHWLWHDQWKPDARIQEMVASLRQPHLEQLEQQVATSQEVIGRKYKSESPFDRLVGNLLLEAFRGEVAILPGVGYGISLHKGPVTSEQIYKLLPHPSRIVTLTMTGRQLRQTLEQSAANLKPADKLAAVGGLIQTSGIGYEMDLSKPAGQRISQVQVGKSPFSDTKSYKIVTHNGLLSGLHNYDQIGQGSNINRTGQSLTEFVLAKLQEKKVITFPLNMGEVRVKK